MTNHTDDDDEFYTEQIQWEAGISKIPTPDPDPDPRPDPVGHPARTRANQFKPGQSGNPRGRPRKAKKPAASPNLLAALAEMMAQPMQVMKGGKKIKMSTEQVLATRVFNLLMSDDPKIVFKAMDSMMKMGIGDALQAIMEREEERRLSEESEQTGWDAEMEAAYQMVEAEFSGDGGRSQYDYAEALMTCNCPALAPWREGKAEEIQAYRQAHPEEFGCDAGGPTTRPTGPHVGDEGHVSPDDEVSSHHQHGPHSRTSGPDVRGDQQDRRADDPES